MLLFDNESGVETDLESFFNEDEVDYVPTNREKSQIIGSTKWMMYDYDTPSAEEKINSRKKWKSELKRMGIGNHKYSVRSSLKFSK